MKKYTLIFIGIISLATLSGCTSNQVALTVYSNPSGAVIHTASGTAGYSPATLYYSISDNDRKQGYLRINWIGAKWVSGASSIQKTLTIPLSRGNNQSFVLQRPNVKGYATDAQFSLQVQTLRAQQAQARAAQEQVAATKKAANDAYWQNTQRNRELQNLNSYIRYGY